MSDHRTAPAAARNRDPILAALRAHLPPAGLVLELASGTGEHALWFARHLPALRWQPTDADTAALASIAAWRADSDLPNLLAPLPLDAAAPAAWPIQQADAMVAINMIHIAPWAASQGLFAGAARLLPSGAPLILYGPYREADQPTAPSNEAFDADLRARNPAWGLRDRDQVAQLAAHHGIDMADRIEMPANNLVLVFRKRK